MKFPISWLEEYVDVPTDMEYLADRLTSRGLKVESITRPGEGINNVVAGRVLKIAKHPRADQLVLVDVDVGGEELRIVCGVQNFEVGDMVPVALTGATLPEGRVERVTKRGEQSEGMLCSPRELGVSDDHSGILVLPPDQEPGADVRPILGLNDYVLDLEITPNRPDAMSLLGVAREVASPSGMTGDEGNGLRVPDATLPKGATAVADFSAVEVEDLRGCPRYLARVIDEVKLGPAPSWVQRRLWWSGFRPISNVVDATNYAMLVTGHPMHAFDLDRLDGGRIVVRRARDGERLVTLDGDERALDPDDLMICDAARPVALAGIMGGAETEVSPTTRRVLLESAYFDPKSIFRASKRHGLRSESSARFERGADPNGADFASRLASRLMIEWADARVAEGTIDVYPEPVEPWMVSVRPPRANLVLGTNFGAGDIQSALERLDFEPNQANGRIDVRVPTRRPDVVGEEDLVEEVARLYGYENLPSTLPAGSNRSGFLTYHQRAIRGIRRRLVGAGLYEAQTSSLIGPADLERIGYPEDHEARRAIRLSNPISQDASLLRPSLLPGLLASTALNVSRRTLSVRLFEIGRCFLRSGEVLPREPLRVAIAMHGPVEQTWLSDAREMDLFDLKGVIEGFLPGGIGETYFEASDHPILHPGRTATLRVNGDDLGVMGELSAAAQRRYDLPHRVLVAELELDVLLEVSGWGGLFEVPRFPAILRDIAVTVPEEVPAGRVLATARMAASEVVEEARIFDVYRGEQAGPGRKSIAMSFIFRRGDRTLTDDEAQAVVEQITRAVEERHGGQIRG